MTGRITGRCLRQPVRWIKSGRTVALIRIIAFIIVFITFPIAFLKRGFSRRQTATGRIGKRRFNQRIPAIGRCLLAPFGQPAANIKPVAGPRHGDIEQALFFLQRRLRRRFHLLGIEAVAQGPRSAP